MKKIIVCFVIAAIVSSCTSSGDSGKLPQFDTLVSGDKFHVETYAVDGGFGYDIFLNDKKIIHQNIIPVIQDVKGFATPDDALKCGHLVVTKLIESTDLPSVDRDELKKLNIIQ